MHLIIIRKYGFAFRCASAPHEFGIFHNIDDRHTAAGHGGIYTMAIGLARSFPLSIAAAFGCTLGILPAATGSVIGLAALLHTSATAFLVIKYLGVAYLFYMAWNIARAGGALDISTKTTPQSAGRIALSGMLINMLNPKLSLFFLAFLPQFVPAGAGAPALITLASAFMGLTFIVFIGYGAFAVFLRKYIIARPSVLAWVRRTFGGIFGLLGAKLALTD